MASVGAPTTEETILSRTISFVDTTAYRTGSAGVSRIDVDHGNADKSSLVLDKALQLSKGPRMKRGTLRPVSSNPSANVRQLFDGYRPLRAFGLCHDLLGYEVVRVRSEAALLCGSLYEEALCGGSALRLKARSESAVSVAKPVDLPAGVKLPVGVGGDILDAEVHAENTVEVDRISFFNFAGGEEIEDALAVDKITLALLSLHQFVGAFRADIGNLNSSVERGNRSGAQIRPVTEVAQIIRDRAMLGKPALTLLIELIGVGDLGDSPNGHLGRESKPLPHLMVNEFMKVVLSQLSSLPAALRDIVAGGVDSLKRVFQRVRLFSRANQLQLCGQFHGSMLLRNPRKVKYGKEEAICYCS